MKIVVDAFWDEAAKVWVASARDAEIGLVTEADTIEQLQRKLALMVPDLLGDDRAPFQVELVTRSIVHIAA